MGSPHPIWHERATPDEIREIAEIDRTIADLRRRRSMLLNRTLLRSSSSSRSRSADRLPGPISQPSGNVRWEKADLFFLKDAVRRGMPYAQIAGFLGRTEAEVREQSRALRSRPSH